MSSVFPPWVVCGGRVCRKVCHVSRPGVVPAAAVNTALGWIVVVMAEFISNSAITTGVTSPGQ